MASGDEMNVESSSRPPSPVLDHDAREKELNDQYPNRPRNHSKTLPFHTLPHELFDPLLRNKTKQPAGAVNRRRIGPKAMNSQNPHEIRRSIIERYISQWRKEVGGDIFPVFRLIMPDKDRERPMYGLKEKILAKLFIKIMKIDKNSDDGWDLLNWKMPSRGNSAKKAGDFPGRMHEVLSKRPFRTEYGDMSIEDVNNLLDKLSSASKEENQLPILEEFYHRMNADELKWLVSIILREMNVGATEKTFFLIWHPDAAALFNISSSLRRVCWELWNPNIRLEGEDRGVSLMSCYQPQLAQFQLKQMKMLPEKMHVSEEDPEFWIEEKLDGERMQMHMQVEKDEHGPDKMRFKFWSRKAKDYTYLYGDSIDDASSALTRHLGNAFTSGVESIILDGEMITWDLETDKIVPFGTLKTAALEQQRNPFASGPRPLYRVFDILYLNGQPLTRYTLRDRRKALERSVTPVKRRMEIHTFTIGYGLDDVQKALRQVVEEASEGLVVKNPRSAYKLNDRNDDWIKVKPEYMEEFGEELDCLIIGGYYGSGKRGGNLSSFLCGLRVDDGKEGRPKSQKFLSFFKVGGGMNANDYANIRHHTEGKWIKWDARNPPTEYIELGGGEQFQRERPDMWIKPPDSLVIQAKAASVAPSEEYATTLTLRFPRFQRLRSDKTWETALSLHDFYEVRERAESRKKNKAMEVDQRNKRHQRIDLRKKPLQVAGYSMRPQQEQLSGTAKSESTDVFRGLTMYVLTDCTVPENRSKAQLEEMIKQHGGHIVQTAQPPPSSKAADFGSSPQEIVCIASRNTVKVASLRKSNKTPILQPIWLFDCIEQARKDFSAGLSEIPLRPELARHVFHSPADRVDVYEGETDQFGDSYARDTTVEELKRVMENMSRPTSSKKHQSARLVDEAMMDKLGETAGWMFRGCRVFIDDPDAGDMDVDGAGSGTSAPARARLSAARTTAQFGGAVISDTMHSSTLTHVVVGAESDVQSIRRTISEWKRVPRVMTLAWIEESWRAGTRLDEERFRPA